MELSDKLYKWLKYGLTIAVPAFVTYLTTLGEIWGFDPVIVIRTLTATATFIGTLFAISCYNYNKPVPVDVTGLQYLDDDDADSYDEDDDEDGDEDE